MSVASLGFLKSESVRKDEQHVTTSIEEIDAYKLYIYALGASQLSRCSLVVLRPHRPRPTKSFFDIEDSHVQMPSLSVIYFSDI